jgi:membrane-bound serine protease (ClpP class)
MLTNPNSQTFRSGRTGRILLWALLLMAGLAVATGLFRQSVQAQSADAPTGRVLTIDGPIGPATMDYLVRGIEQAEAEGAELVVIRLDTPGGLMASTRDIIKKILASKVPVVTWVTPAGARAASAGTYLLYGSHVAAMEPATHLGSATPVQMGGLPGSNEPDTKPDSKTNPENESNDSAKPSSADSDSESTQKNRGDSAMERKVLEDAVSYIRGLAERHGRNADWAEAAVRQAVNLNANEALEKNVIDVVAASLPELMNRIDGFTVVMSDGERSLSTEGIKLQSTEPDWRTELLSVITDPNVAYFLMIIGFYGIFFELANPGSIFPGVIGAICLVLALFAFQVLSVNYAGLALIILGLAFIVGEAFMPSFGILGIGGIVAFVTGSIILMDGSHQDISLPTIGGTAAVAGGFILWTAIRFLGLRRKPPVSGIDNSAHEPVTALDDFQPRDDGYHGHVRFSGERWNAVSNQPVSSGQRLEVTTVEGLTVHVTSAKAEKEAP